MRNIAGSKEPRSEIIPTATIVPRPKATPTLRRQVECDIVNGLQKSKCRKVQKQGQNVVRNEQQDKVDNERVQAVSKPQQKRQREFAFGGRWTNFQDGLVVSNVGYSGVHMNQVFLHGNGHWNQKELRRSNQRYFLVKGSFRSGVEINRQERKQDDFQNDHVRGENKGCTADWRHKDEAVDILSQLEALRLATDVLGGLGSGFWCVLIVLVPFVTVFGQLGCPPQRLRVFVYFLRLQRRKGK